MNALKLRLVREVPVPYGERPQVLGPSDAAALLEPIYAGEVVEVCIVLLLDRRHRLAGWHEVGRGGVSHAPLEPREVLRVVLLSGCPAFMVAHNHPSGEAAPSAEDKAATRRLDAAAKILGVEFLDHIVVGDIGEWCSLRREGWQ